MPSRVTGKASPISGGVAADIWDVSVRQRSCGPRTACVDSLNGTEWDGMQTDRGLAGGRVMT